MATDAATGGESVAASPAGGGGSLGARIGSAVERAGLRRPRLSDRPQGEELARARSALDRAVDRVMAELRSPNGARRPRLVDRCELVAELHELRHLLDAAGRERRLRALTGVQEALSRLRGVETIAQMLDKATLELCRCCSFDRAILSRVDGSHLVAESVHFEGAPEWAEQILRMWRNDPPQLHHLLLETELLRRRAPALVSNPADDERTYRPLVLATKTRSYVAAPIMPEGRVIGFIHADRYMSGEPVDELDRDTLWTFAEGFGYAAERTVLLERLHTQRDQVRRQVMSIDAILNELCEAEVEIAQVDAESADVARTAAAMFVAPESRVESLLTRRELEVLRLMASGARNAEIADRLVISEGTVKSHVKHILRKLRATNRAEAVSRFMRLSGALALDP